MLKVEKKLSVLPEKEAGPGRQNLQQHKEAGPQGARRRDGTPGRRLWPGQFYDYSNIYRVRQQKTWIPEY